MDRRVFFPLAGAALLAAFSIAALPFSRGLLRAPRTPYDASEAHFLVPAWILLRRAETLIPQGASIVVRIEPRNDWIDSYLHRIGIALLPGRRIVPAALWGVPSEPAVLAEASYELVVGAAPPSPAGRLVLQIPEGSVWRRGS